ncbi:hypothetical protein B0H14DRAFT_3547166 [Mycena olivaceomarginata]|nr:hypothetical protein B0H14DRAFT_3547166 [Mycena olivaceomarginata]
MAEAGEPVLPPELEREVFETTALMHAGTIRTLLRVAKRVLIWPVFMPPSSQSNANFERGIAPFLYRVICLNDDNRHVYSALLRVMETKTLKFIRDAVRHFAFVSQSHSMAEAKRILPLCTGIVSFGCFISFLDPTVPALFVGTRVHQLVLELQSLFPPGCVNLAHPMFGYVTHLDILDDSGVEKLLLDIRLLPALTHFSLDSDTPRRAL